MPAALFDGAVLMRFETVYGSPCATDDQCGPSLHCVDPNGDELAPGVGGPAHGFCTKACGGANDCHDGANGAACTALSEGAPTFCFPTCALGVPADSTSKCLDRADLGCRAGHTSPTSGVCVPTCGERQDCGSRACDPGTGLCVDQVSRTGVPLGGDCSNDTCASGVCTKLGLFTSVCTSLCVLGTVGCGFDPTSPDRLQAYCFPVGVASGEHDLGICTQLCDCDTDCGPRLKCAKIEGYPFLVESARGRRGYCTPSPVLEDGGDAELRCQ